MSLIKGHQKSHRVQEMERLMQMGKKHHHLHMKLKMSVWQWTVRFAKFIKAFLDISVSFIMLVLLSPLLLITAIFIYIQDPGPIFYVANRVGHNGAHFGFIKFRSMYLNADKAKDTLDLGLSQNPDDARQHKMHANLQLRNGEYEEGRISIEKVLLQTPDDAESWSLKGAAHAYLEQKEPAVLAFETAMKLDPKEKSYRKNRDAVKKGE